MIDEHEESEIEIDRIHQEEEDDLDLDEPDEQDPEDERDEMIAILTEERNLYKDQMTRSIAEMQNARRRNEQEKVQLRKFATEDLVQDLIPILDNFERTIEACEQSASLESIMDGVKLIDKQLRSVLEQRNLRRINAKGEMFDEMLHEAVVSIPTEEHEEGKVLAELQAGYIMSDKVVRPARVKVAKKP